MTGTLSTHVDQVLEAGERCPDLGDPWGKGPVVDHRREVRVVEEIGELVVHIAVVHVHRHRPHLVGGQRGFDPLDAVGAVDADVVARPESASSQVVGEAVAARLELCVRAPLLSDYQDLAVGNRVDGVLKEVGDVVRHDLTIRQTPDAH